MFRLLPKTWFLPCLAGYLLAAGCSKKVTQKPTPVLNNPKREFRAAWIATVDNIDWPSRKNLASPQQQAEFVRLLEAHQTTGLNAVLVQVRAAADAFYAQSPEPWSEWLTGRQGQEPSPAYDPLAFMIEQAHNRNMEFHAWLNLSRGTHKASKSIAPNHITQTRPDWFFKYDNHLLFDLGQPEVRQYITAVVRNIVRNYDVDGIHFDDYFYPYTVAGQRINDDASFRKFGAGFQRVDDWRRNNVDLLIKSIAEAIQKEKPLVKFGISPFSVWRNASADPEGSATQGGQTSYDNLYADTRKWFREGWIDYIAPQIYFTVEFDKVPYKTMVDWWVKQPANRHIYIGQGTYRVDAQSKDTGWADPTQLPRQIRYNWSKKLVSGSIFYNTTSLIKNPLSVTDSLRTLYARPVLQPSMPWKDNVPPNAPTNLEAKQQGNGEVFLSWKAPEIPSRDNQEIWGWVVYRFLAKERINLESPRAVLAVIRHRGDTIYTDTSAEVKGKYIYIITAIDRLHNESASSNPIWVK